ncbi:prolipoprotein diacylglyceryl transferase [Candidatus Daviesbacteria bacterium]|nr:prolipoprotein diacylglyceryl transferase [Candidatus Daviesbacteria bacterium]
MKPVLFSVGALSISSFGFFLLIACGVGVYIIWRIVRVYDLDEEKSLDLIILTIAGGLIVSRLYFVLFHIEQFDSVIKIILVNRYPGFSFWGAFFGAFGIFRVLCARFKLNFWQMADLVMPGVFLGISVATLGCLLGSCEYGLVTNAPFAIIQAGLVDKRFPVQVVESLLFFLGFLYLWKGALRFHRFGAITAEGLMLIGIFKFMLEFFYGSRQQFGVFSAGLVYSVLLIISALWVYYFTNKRSPLADLKMLKVLAQRSDKRHELVSKIGKNWYNLKVDFKVTFQKAKKGLLKLLNVRANPQKF